MNGKVVVVEKIEKIGDKDLDLDLDVEVFKYEFLIVNDVVLEFEKVNCIVFFSNVFLEVIILCIVKKIFLKYFVLILDLKVDFF